MKKIRILLVLVCTTLFANNENFFSLQRKIAQFPEDVVQDGGDWDQPYYTNTCGMEKKKGVDQFFSPINPFVIDDLNIDTIEAALKNLLKQRWWNISQQQDLKKGIYWSGHIVAAPQTKFVVWGDTFGAAHSLMRDLGYLREQGIIDDTFKIIKPDYYFIFLGNIVDRSPYSLQTLYILVLLMARNPDQVIYNAGHHEFGAYWKNSNLHQQIKSCYGSDQKKILNFEKMVDGLFVSLPIMVYITTPNDPKNVICLSSQIPKFQVTKTVYKSFFSKKVGSISFVPLYRILTTADNLPLRVIVTGSSVMQQSLNSVGLNLLLPHNNATVWSILSSPTPLYQKNARFFRDSFAVITIGNTIEQSVIEYHSQDIRNNEGFKVGPSFNLAFGQTVGSSAVNVRTTYSFGSTMALTKGGLFIGPASKEAILAVVNESNQSNFLDGIFVRAIILDDKYDATKAYENVKTLQDTYHIDTLLFPVGSPTLLGYFDLVKSGKITVLFPQTGSTFFREKSYKNIIHWRPSFQDEARALIEYMITQKSAKKFVFFYQNDAYGITPLRIAHEVLKEHGITDWVDIPYGQSDVDFKAAVNTIKKESPDAIGLFSIAAPTKKFLQQAGIETLFGKMIFGLSGLGDENMEDFLKERGISIIFSALVPSPKYSDLEIVKEYRALMNRYNIAYDIFGLEAYISTSLVLEALKSIKGDITAQKIIQYFESLKDFSYKGLTMTFNPNTRNLSHTVWLRLSERNWQAVTVESGKTSDSKKT